MGQLYALQLTPLYTAQATLMLDAGKQKIINSEAVLSGPDASMYGAIESQMELMRSRDVVRRAAEKLNLNRSRRRSMSLVRSRKILSLIIPTR